MTKKNLAVFLAMAVFLAAMTVVSGGCSGGGGGGNKVTGIPLAFDTDKDGIPDVFDDRPEVSSEYALATTVKSKIAGSGFDGSVYGEGAPLSVPRTFEGSILEPLESIDTVSGDNGEQIDVVSRDTDVDIFAVNLEAGKQYSIVFYDPNDMGGRAVEFTPSVWVTPFQPCARKKSPAMTPTIVGTSYRWSTRYRCATGWPRTRACLSLCRWRRRKISEPLS